MTLGISWNPSISAYPPGMPDMTKYAKFPVMKI